MKIYKTKPIQAHLIQWQLCECHKCKSVKQCTPKFDFYGNTGELLTCETCFRVELEKEHGITKVIYK